MGPNFSRSACVCILLPRSNAKHKSRYKTHGGQTLIRYRIRQRNNCHLFHSNLVPMALPRSKWRRVGDADEQQIASSSNIYINQWNLYYVIRRGFVCWAETGKQVGVIQCLKTNVINFMRINHMWSYVTRMYPYVTPMYSYVTRVYPYVTRMHSYVTRMLLVVPVCSFSHDPAIVCFMAYLYIKNTLSKEFRTQQRASSSKRVNYCHTTVHYYIPCTGCQLNNVFILRYC